VEQKAAFVATLEQRCQQSADGMCYWLYDIKLCK